MLGSGLTLNRIAAMKKILVPTVDMPIGSDDAYRVAEFADSIGADVIVLFVVNSIDGDSYRRGNLSIEIFEEAAQNYDFSLDGYIMVGDPHDIIGRMSQKWAVDMVLLGGDEEGEVEDWSTNLSLGSACPVELLRNYSSQQTFS